MDTFGLQGKNLFTYIYDLHIVKEWKNKLDKLLFLNIYNARECIVIFKTILHKK
jgi:hypothetical protein